MSKTLKGNIFGAFIVIGGCLFAYAAYRSDFDWGMVIGVGLALLGAAIINPTTLKAGAADLKDSAAGLVELIPGRRAGDTKEVKVLVKKGEGDERG